LRRAELAVAELRVLVDVATPGNDAIVHLRGSSIDPRTQCCPVLRVCGCRGEERGGKGAQDEAADAAGSAPAHENARGQRGRALAHDIVASTDVACRPYTGSTP